MRQVIFAWTHIGDTDGRGKYSLAEKIDKACEEASDHALQTGLVIKEIRPQLHVLENGFFAYVLTVLFQTPEDEEADEET